MVIPTALHFLPCDPTKCDEPFVQSNFALYDRSPTFCRFLHSDVLHFGGLPARGSFGPPLGTTSGRGEMIAGVFLGPSLLGLLFPEVQGQLFPKESLKVLYVGAQLGVGLYMFLVGVEFNVETFLNRARSAISVSVAG
jgi:hypothetical protein